MAKKKKTDKVPLRGMRLFYRIISIFIIFLSILLLPIQPYGLFFLLFGLFFLYLSRAKKLSSPKEKPNTSEQNTVLDSVEKNTAGASKGNGNTRHNAGFFGFYSFYNKETGCEWKAKYIYDDVSIYRPDVSFKDLLVYDPVRLIPEPENAYDPRAISVKFQDTKIGYLNKGKLQDMVHDYIDRGDLVRAQIQKIEGDNVFLKIFFCKKRSELLPPLESVDVKLSGNASKEYQSNIEDCYVGQEIDVDYNAEEDRFEVSYDGMDIGNIPSSKYEFFKSLYDKDYEFSGEVIDITENASGKYSVEVSIKPH